MSSGGIRPSRVLIAQPCYKRSDGDGMESSTQKYDKNFQKQEGAAKVNPKEPKFVPYEPYKGAVKPIIPVKHKKNKKLLSSSIPRLINDNNSSSLLLERENEHKKEIQNLHLEWYKEKKILENEIQLLKSQLSVAEDRLNIQSEVKYENHSFYNLLSC